MSPIYAPLPLRRSGRPGRSRCTAAAVAVTSAVALLTAGCQMSQGPNCTLIGAESGVTVLWRPADFPAGARHRLCADGECRERGAPPAADPRAFLDVPLPEESGPREVGVRFTVTDPAAGGRVVHDRSARVTLRKVTPNGEACGPTAWQAAVRADPRAGLVEGDFGDGDPGEGDPGEGVR
ncbi:hypothetical protein AB0E83_15205 [Streptomyces sp. NPDC035033]|uniref:hypothetical protein n=1 Tax=Streptomyces sp. NPDC035033 TaxID=3155368 RepID=UPI0033C5E282